MLGGLQSPTIPEQNILLQIHIIGLIWLYHAVALLSLWPNYSTLCFTFHSRFSEIFAPTGGPGSDIILLCRGIAVCPAWLCSMYLVEQKAIYEA